MRRVVKIAGGIFGVLIVAVAALVAAAFLIDWNRLNGRAAAAVGGLLGRDVEIGGLDVKPGWTTSVTVRDVRIANRRGFEGDFARAGMISLTFKPLTFVIGDRVISNVTLDRPELHMVRARAGESNWTFAPQGEGAKEAAAPEERGEFPEVESLLVKNGRMSYRDETRGLSLEGTIATAVSDETGGVEASLEGTLEERPVRFAFAGGSFEQLQDSEVPYPFDLTLRVGKTEVHAEGSAMEPVRLRGLDTDFSLRGPSLAEVFPIFGVPMPITPPYSLRGRLSRANGAWALRDFTSHIGGSDLRGWVRVDYQPERPVVRGELVSQRLDAADLGGLVGRAKEGEARKSGKRGGLFPTTPIDTERFKAADLDIRFRGKRLVGPVLRGDGSIGMHVVLRNGVARVTELQAAVPDGAISGTVRVDANATPPHARAEIRLDDFRLKALFRGTRFEPQTVGLVGGNAKLEGRGWSFAEILGRGRGSLRLLMREGSLSGLLLEAADLDVVEALALVAGRDTPVRVRCARIDAAMGDGVLRPTRAVVDTVDTVLTVAGAVDLGEETMNLHVQGHPKDFSLVDAAAPVAISGSMTDPTLRIGGMDLLPFFEKGETDGVDCGALLDARR